MGIFCISSTPLVINPTSDTFLTPPSSCQTSCLYLRDGTLRRGILDNVWPTSSTTSKRSWLNNASLMSNSSSRGVSPSSLYLNLWLASIPFPTLPSPLLATGISVRTTWRLTQLSTNCFTAGAWTPTTLALPWNGSTGNSTSYRMKTIPSDMPAILTSTGFPIPGTL